MDAPARKEGEMVNHPGHYEKVTDDGKEHIECIDLLDILTEGYSGIAALDIGQQKYLYRFGSKEDAKMSLKEKAVEDANKALWYLNDFRERAYDNAEYGSGTLPEGFKCTKHWNQAIVDLVIEEFTFDKAKELQLPLARILTKTYCLQTFEDIDVAIAELESMISTMKGLEF